MLKREAKEESANNKNEKTLKSMAQETRKKTPKIYCCKRSCGEGETCWLFKAEKKEEKL